MTAYTELIAAVEASGYPVEQLSSVKWAGLGRSISFDEWKVLSTKKPATALLRRDTQVVLLVDDPDPENDADLEVIFQPGNGNSWDVIDPQRPMTVDDI